VPIERWWPTPIYFCLFDGDALLLDQISQEIDAAIKTTEFEAPWPEAAMLSSFRYGKTNTFLDLTPTLKKYIIKHANFFTTVDFFIAESWINKGGAGSRQEKHNHSHSYISGCYYHKTNVLDGDIVFDCNDKLLQMFTICNPIHYKPEIGKIILFPSYLTHMVQTNNTEHERISIAFNIVEAQSEAKWRVCQK